MGDRLRIEFEKLTIQAELLPGKTSKAVVEKLPFSSQVNRWGDEIYFSIPVEVGLQKGADDVVEKGEVGYWPPGRAMAIFWGPTPASLANECRAASPVNVFARIGAEQLRDLASVEEGSRVVVRLEMDDAGTT